MNFAPPRAARAPRENIVPMINVVFLLLIFFLMTAQIAPPDPVPVTLPLADAPETELAPDTLYITASGETALGTLRDAAALEAFAKLDAAMIRADAGLDGNQLAQILQDLTALGLRRVTLLTGMP